jgi:RNA polymerase sigma factor (sigma-70 family)
MDALSVATGEAPGSGSSIRLVHFGDERLARLVGSGSERAFATLYARYHQPLYRYCRSIVHDDGDAQDALQSTLASAFAALKQGRRDAPVRPWLFRIAHNEAISLIRRRRERELSDPPEQFGPSAEQVAGERARLGLLVADLRELPDRQRGALVMRELSGLSHEEIALALGISVGAAKQTVFEARRSLLKFVEGRAMACEEVRRTISDADGRALRGRRMRAHLRDCGGCAAFAAAIPTRGADLRAIAPPLPALAAAGLLARALGSGHGGGVAAGATGKAVGAAFAAKVLAGAAIAATATVGVTTALSQIAHPKRRPLASRIAPQASSSVTARGHLTTHPPGSPHASRGEGGRGDRRLAYAGSPRHAPIAVRGVGARVAQGRTAAHGRSFAHTHSSPAHGRSSAHAHSTRTRGVAPIPSGSGGSRGAAPHRNPRAPIPTVPRPSSPVVSAPGTSAAPTLPSPPLSQTPPSVPGQPRSRAP